MHPRLSYLFDKYVSSQLTVEETREWSALILDPQNKETLQSTIINYSDQQNDVPVLNEEKAWQELLDKMNNDHPEIMPRIYILHRAWFRVAAAIILFFGLGAYFWLTRLNNEIPTAATQPVPVENDILPGSNKAVITLSDGREIVLDEAAIGQLAQDGGSTVIKSSDGKIIYNPASIRSQEVVFNTMSTPRGGQYQLTLPDGSRVWLNAASSITYPTTFATATREVSITGEVYFEVEPNKEKPFIVTISPAGGTGRAAGSLSPAGGGGRSTS